MQFNLTGLTTLAVAAAVGAWIFSDDRPDILPAMAGCFVGETPLARSIIKIDPSGALVTEAGATSVAAHETGLGVDLLPKQKVVVKHGELSIGSGDPWGMRITADRRGFFVPNEEGSDILFQRASCT